MKKSELRQLIREEIEKTLKEEMKNAQEVQQVISILNSIDVDEDTMLYIIDKVKLSYAIGRRPSF